MKNSKIEWTDHTVNLWWGCSKKNTGCLRCYAETLSRRWGNDIWGEDKPRKLIKSAFPDLYKYQKQAEKENKLVKVFIGSMMDIFEDNKKLSNPLNTVEWYTDTVSLRQRLFEKIYNHKYDNLIFLFLTKRPKNINHMISLKWLYTGTPNNVWFGTSISDQETADEYINELRKYQSIANLFLSIEPQVEEINHLDLTGIKWVIQGGESGHHKRPFKIEWAECMRDICKEQEIPYFFKQIDKVHKIPKHLLIREFPKF